jgi:hypothetical protein
MDYAKSTTVSMESSQQEVTRLLRRAGAEKCMSGWDGDCAFVAFVLKGVPIRMKVEMPGRQEFETETGRHQGQRRLA